MDKMNNNVFNAIIIEENNDGTFSHRIKQKKINDLPNGDLLVRVKYSSLNYKDALSFSGNKGVTKYYPHTPGIDAVGIVEASECPEFIKGEKVIVIGYDMGMNTAGGFGEYIRVPKEWASLLPESLSALDSMIIGTAGLTAGLCVQSLERMNGVLGKKAIVTGSTGGVGCLAVKLLSKLGAEVTAITGKKEEVEFLKSNGAKEILYIDDFLESVRKPMSKGQWDIAIDVAGGDILSGLISSMNYGGTITCCGLVSNPRFETTVFPFILRGNSLIGIDSGETPIKEKTNIWEKFSSDWKLDGLDRLNKTVDMYGLMDEIRKILKGNQVGRVVLKHD